ncbi:hypothetical protein BDP55DRAFT_688399 [Colletotrichum godetiae]|uniref:Uncharacterized protein n=1 Tax=Colletotrichum godetiae TaxID=1209918 RepID=A0AAJ0A7W6_9PEZI|nr:uncharacterized protein BDP55DRAFT_688399 [Colletotrichum godetiae]KAK1656647.1 hypothetical protein BDP55DRAFT_688399 [Colletotrichum godetiae]
MSLSGARRVRRRKWPIVASTLLPDLYWETSCQGPIDFAVDGSFSKRTPAVAQRRTGFARIAAGTWQAQGFVNYHSSHRTACNHRVVFNLSFH